MSLLKKKKKKKNQIINQTLLNNECKKFETSYCLRISKYKFFPVCYDAVAVQHYCVFTVAGGASSGNALQTNKNTVHNFRLTYKSLSSFSFYCSPFANFCNVMVCTVDVFFIEDIPGCPII